MDLSRGFFDGEIERSQLENSDFVSASSIGYYDFIDRSGEIDENREKGMGSGADLCGNWEKAGDWFKDEHIGSRITKIGVSLVLGRNGGNVAPKPTSIQYMFRAISNELLETSYLIRHKEPFKT
ncbi:hypothetical protein [Sphingobacterium cellulitidis]|uniref:hypothetical protein n=1 Tax=Sphingobacterium cellulitidis TaxID=1768011 RepID=UPI003C7DECC6